MKLHLVLLATGLPVILAGCAAQEFRARVDACEAQKFRTQVERVTCLNNAESKTARFAAIRAYRQSLRLALAAKVDAGEITQAQADEQYARVQQQIRESESRRQIGMAGIQGALIGAAFH